MRMMIVAGLCLALGACSKTEAPEKPAEVQAARLEQASCAAPGQACDSTDCCSGACVVTAEGRVCGAAPQCAASGQSCENSDCCSGSCLVTAAGRVCGDASRCAGLGESCAQNDCCDGVCSSANGKALCVAGGAK